MTTKKVQAWAKGLSYLEPVKIKVRKTLWLSHVVSTSFCLSHPTVTPQPPVVRSHGLQITCLSFRLDVIWRHRRFYQGKQVWESSLCLWLAWEQHHTIFSTSHGLITDFSITWFTLPQPTFSCGQFLKSLLNLLHYHFCFSCSGGFGLETCEILAPQPGTEHAPLHEPEVLSTVPPGKCPPTFFFKDNHSL